MNPELIFSIANTAALIGWIILAVAPRWKWTKTLILSGGLILLLSAIYLTIIALTFGESEGGFDSLANVMKLFEDPNAVLAGWIHYLAFDLFVGTWIISNSQKLGIKHLYIVPCLFFTFMFGPIGLLLYFIVRAATTKKVLHENF